jgi:heme-degrading monooxygenase HmoA
LSHAAGAGDDDTFIVTEVWNSRADQAAFLDSRLGAALAAGGVTTMPKVLWVPLMAYHTPGA